MGTAHAVLGASSMYRWKVCAGSVREEAKAPKKRSSKAADVGTTAHYLGELCLLNEHEPEDYIGSPLGLAAGAADDHKVTTKMAENVRIYVDTVRQQLKASPHSTLFVEEKFDLSDVYEGMFGTNDACVVVPFQKLTVIDYKNGVASVDAEDNDQLRYYALGACQKFGFMFPSIEVIIVQPNDRDNVGVPVKRASFSGADLQKWRDEVLIPAAAATENPDAPLTVGSHCFFCAAAATCPAKNMQKDEAIEAFNSVVPVGATPEEMVALPNPADVPAEKRGEFLEALKILDAWVRSANAFIEEDAVVNGVVPEGHKLVYTNKHRKVTDEKQIIQQFGEKYGDALMTAPKLKTPAQLEKVVDAEDKKVLQQWIEKPEGEIVLASVKDKRKEAKPMNLIDIFNSTK